MTGTPVSIILDTGQGNSLLLVPSPQSGGFWPWASDVGLISFSQLTPYAGGCYLFIFGRTHCIQEFPGQGSKLRHGSDSAGSVTCWASRELQELLILVIKVCLPYFPHFWVS